jgi:hypothetical protein
LPVLPDGLFSNPKSQFGLILECLKLDNVNKFYGHLDYFADLWDILWQFGTFCVHLVLIFCFGVMYREKSGNPGRCVSLHLTQLATKKDFRCR